MGGELACYSPTWQEANKSPWEIPAVSAAPAIAWSHSATFGDPPGLAEAKAVKPGSPGVGGKLNSAISLPRRLMKASAALPETGES